MPRKPGAKIDGRTREGRMIRANGASVVQDKPAPKTVAVLLDADVVETLRAVERLTGQTPSAVIRRMVRGPQARTA